MSELKITALGGGTGLSTLLRGLKLHTNSLTAIVTVADDGGSSGILRHDMGMLPPGDVRNCIAALADVDPEYGRLLNHRFRTGVFEGHTVGNMMLAALNEMSANFDEAVSRLSKLAGISGRVIPVSNDSIRLRAKLRGGDTICGESNIGGRGTSRDRIERVFITPPDARPVESAIEAIKQADLIVLGPGSLYTSVIPNLLVNGVVDAVYMSKAVKVYVCNIMTQPGETDGMSASEHLDAIESHTRRGIVDYIVVNDAPIPNGVARLYATEGAEPVEADMVKLEDRVSVLHGNLFIVRNGQIRHNFSRLARSIVRLIGLDRANDTQRGVENVIFV